MQFHQACRYILSGQPGNWEVYDVHFETAAVIDGVAQTGFKLSEEGYAVIDRLRALRPPDEPEKIEDPFDGRPNDAMP